ncbi:MAG TPA: energy transducer TonB [Pyrinomonadaceae bacterium]|nr:energy transducer TonB [Pyrinomonadaceae bacterium]
MRNHALFVLTLSAALAAHAAPAGQAPAPRPAQQPAGEPPARWQRFAPAEEEFTVDFPSPAAAYHMSREVKDSPTHETVPARVYTAYHDGVVFLVASFDEPRAHEPLSFFVGEFFGAQELPAVRGSFTRHVRSGGVDGWQYAFTHRGAEGVARFFLTSKHAYMAEAVGGGEAHPAVARFLKSFKLAAAARSPRREAESPPRAAGPEQAVPVRNPPRSLPATIDADPPLIKPDARDTPGDPKPAPGGVSSGPGVGGGLGPGRTAAGGGPPGSSPPFRSVEVAQRANVVFKPTPGFTEEARRNNVTGLVRLRCVLTSSGEVTKITVINGLPDGLTEKAIAAARGIRFIPAVMDGRRVSQWVTLEYNFNIY